MEDPVESKVAGITQIQINEKIGYTFGAAMRSILRQDPDVIMVGEIRDETRANTFKKENEDADGFTQYNSSRDLKNKYVKTKPT